LNIFQIWTFISNLSIFKFWIISNQNILNFLIYFKIWTISKFKLFWICTFAKKETWIKN
jgi:hypothetical protein